MLLSASQFLIARLASRVVFTLNLENLPQPFQRLVISFHRASLLQSFQVSSDTLRFVAHASNCQDVDRSVSSASSTIRDKRKLPTTTGALIS